MVAKEREEGEKRKMKEGAVDMQDIGNICFQVLSSFDLGG